MLINIFLSDINYNGADIFQDNVVNDNVLNDKQFLQTTKLSDDWKAFWDLKCNYESGTIFTKKSKLEEDLEKVENQTNIIVEILGEITTLNPDNTMSPFALSQTYLRKAKLILKFIMACAKFFHKCL